MSTPTENTIRISSYLHMYEDVIHTHILFVLNMILAFRENRQSKIDCFDDILSLIPNEIKVPNLGKEEKNAIFTWLITRGFLKQKGNCFFYSDKSSIRNQNSQLK